MDSEAYEYVFFMIYALLGVGVTAFCVWVLPCLLISIWEELIFRSQKVGAFFMREWKIFVFKLDLFLIDLKDHYEWLELEKGRHRKLDVENLFNEMVAEVRDVNEGRRMPVSLRG